MTLSVKDTVVFAWEQYKKQPLAWLKIIVVALIVSGLSSYVAQSAIDGGASPLLLIPLNIADFFVQMVVCMAMIYFALRLHDGKDALLSQFLEPIDLMWRYIGGVIIYGAGVLLGLILLVIPGVIFAIAGGMWPYLLIDKRLGPVEAVKESLRMTRGNRWQLLLLAVVLTVLNLVGLIPLGLGLLITVPVSTLAVVHAYRILERQAPPTANQAEHNAGNNRTDKKMSDVIVQVNTKVDVQVAQKASLS